MGNISEALANCLKQQKRSTEQLESNATQLANLRSTCQALVEENKTLRSRQDSQDQLIVQLTVNLGTLSKILKQLLPPSNPS